MIGFGVFHSFLLYFFRVFNYIAIFLPKTEEEEKEEPNKSSVLNTKRTFVFSTGWNSLGLLP